MSKVLGYDCDGNEIYEYSMDGIMWKRDNHFDGLKANTEYTFYQRYVKTDTTYTSASSLGLKVVAHSHTYDNACDAKCNICGHFHLTSRDGEGRRKKKYSRNEVKEYLQTTRLMLADEKIMHTARILKSQRPQYKGYWQSRYRDMQLIKSA